MSLLRDISVSGAVLTQECHDSGFLTDDMQLRAHVFQDWRNMDLSCDMVRGHCGT